MRNRLKRESGITLIALVITVIVLLILAGVTIGLLTGENGILNTAKNAADKYNNAAIDEQNQIDNILNLIGGGVEEEVPLGFIPIYTMADLQKIATGESYQIKGKTYTMLNTEKYVLMNDINLSGINWVALPEFNGEFDGNYKKIKNMTVNTATQEYSGLFSIIKDGNIRKLGIENCNLVNTKVGAYVGAIAGYTEWPDGSGYEMDQVYVTGYLEADDGVVGAIVGYYRNHYMEMRNTYSDAIVKSTNGIAGGLMGTLDSGHCKNSFSLSQVIGQPLKSGGIAGTLQTPDLSFGKTLWSDRTGTTMEGIGEDFDIYRQKVIDGLMDSMMKQKETFSEAEEWYPGFDFDNIWTIDEGIGYPKLKGFK